MNEELIDYYVNLLIIQYHNKPKAQETISEIITVIMLLEILRLIENGYSIESAVGVQLDILAKYLGASRTITGIPFSRTYFGYKQYGEDPDTSIFRGYKQYGEIVDVQFIRYGESRQAVLELNDEELRQVLQFKVIQNNSNHSVSEIDRLIFDIFDGRVEMIDNLDMSITYQFPLADQRLATIYSSEDLIPRVAGTNVDVDFV